MSSISGLGSVAQAWLTQGTSGVKPPKNSDSDGDNDSSSVSGIGGRHHGGGGGCIFWPNLNTHSDSI
ncbi:hypothetical protein [Methylobacter svalbardensis]|uniref:hypothetical protein n=1 Tax=Methylobacter svalbardensis TaxID=3080016 RepID=UPI0030EB2E92